MDEKSQVDDSLTGPLRDAIDATGRANARVEARRKRIHGRVSGWKRQADLELTFVNQKAVALEILLKNMTDNITGRVKMRLARLKHSLNAASKPIDDARRRILKKTK